VKAAGFDVGKQQVRMDRAYKLLGLFPVKVALHPEVVVDVTINIARSEEEAKIQEEKGTALITTHDEEDLSEKAVKQLEAEEAVAAAAAAQDAPAAQEETKEEPAA